MTWRRYVTLGLVLFIGGVVALSLTRHKWSVPLAVPAGQKIPYATFHCGPIWGSGHIDGPATTAYPLSSKPCTSRSSDQVMSVVDIVVAVAGIGVVNRVGRERAV